MSCDSRVLFLEIRLQISINYNRADESFLSKYSLSLCQHVSFSLISCRKIKVTLQYTSSEIGVIRRSVISVVYLLCPDLSADAVQSFIRHKTHRKADDGGFDTVSANSD